MIKQLAHVCIRTRDLDSTRRFYTEVLGMSVAFEFEREGETCGYYFRAGTGSTFIEVFEGDPGEAGNIQHVAIEVDGLEELIGRIRDRGHEVSERKLGADHSWQAWVTDPSGVSIEFHEYTPESCQVVGGRCVLE